MINLFRVFTSTDGIKSDISRQESRMKLLRENVGEIATDRSLLEAAEKVSALVSETYRL